MAAGGWSPTQSVDVSRDMTTPALSHGHRTQGDGFRGRHGCACSVTSSGSHGPRWSVDWSRVAREVRVVEFIEVIPKSSSGKALRKELRTREAQHAVPGGSGPE